MGDADKRDVAKLGLSLRIGVGAMAKAKILSYALWLSYRLRLAHMAKF